MFGAFLISQRTGTYSCKKRTVRASKGLEGQDWSNICSIKKGEIAMVLDVLKRIAGLVQRAPAVKHMTALIQVPKLPDSIIETGPRRVLDDYFVTPDEVDVSRFTNKADVEKTAVAMMKMFRHDHSPTDYEVVSFKPEGGVRKYYVVWFPKANEFDLWSIKYEPRIRLLTPKMTILLEVIRLAKEQRHEKGFL